MGKKTKPMGEERKKQTNKQTTNLLRNIRNMNGNTITDD